MNIGTPFTYPVTLCHVPRAMFVPPTAVTERKDFRALYPLLRKFYRRVDTRSDRESET